jgi:4-diphosphocytidyl-2-C-methyl-D-erythritol kinase
MAGLLNSVIPRLLNRPKTHDFWDKAVVELDKSTISRQNLAMNQSRHAAQHSYTVSIGQTYFVRSYAKVNLTLDVLGRRDDGYHEVITIMQTLDLYDTLCLTATEEDNVRIICTRSDLSNERNLAVRAAEAVRRHLNLKQGLTIELQKQVPVAAGLGGGSSNAATVLLALQQWWNLPLSLAELGKIAASLGSDVPFFLIGGLGQCEGRGERITPLAPRWPDEMRWILLLKPAIEVSTATVFGSLSPTDYSDGEPSRLLLSALNAGDHFSVDYLHNSLERGVMEHYPEVVRAGKDLREAGAPFVRLSGSGPTLFAPFATLTHAAQTQQRLQNQGYEVYLTRPIAPGSEAIHFF